MILGRILPGISVLVNTSALLEPHVPHGGREDPIVWVFFLVQARSGLQFPPLAGHSPNGTVYRRYLHKHHRVIMMQAF